MSRWPIVSLEEVLRLDLDAVPVIATDTYRMAGVLSYARGLFEREDVLGASTSYKTFYRLHEGQLVLSQLFGWEGALAIVTPDFAGRYVSSQFPTFRPSSNRILLGFLGWCIRRSSLWEQLKGKAKGMGDRRRTINPASLFSCNLPLPPLDEQLRIVAQLDAAADLVAKRQVACEEIEREQRALLSVAFRKITADASRARMGDVAPLVRRSVEIEPEASYTELGVRSFYKGAFHRRSMSGAEFTWQKLFWVREGDLIFSNLMAWEEAIAVARKEDDGCVGNHRILTCEARQDISAPDFLYYYFHTKEGFDQVVQASPGSIARNKTLSSVLLKDITVPLPSLDAQLWFVALLRKARSVVAMQAEVTSELDHLLPSLLDRAFNGETEAESDESEKMRAMG